MMLLSSQIAKRRMLLCWISNRRWVKNVCGYVYISLSLFSLFQKFTVVWNVYCCLGVTEIVVIMNISALFERELIQVLLVLLQVLWSYRTRRGQQYLIRKKKNYETSMLCSLMSIHTVCEWMQMMAMFSKFYFYICNLSRFSRDMEMYIHSNYVSNIPMDIKAMSPMYILSLL